jgi:hypothetical protein
VTTWQPPATVDGPGGPRASFRQLQPQSDLRAATGVQNSERGLRAEHRPDRNPVHRRCGRTWSGLRTPGWPIALSLPVSPFVDRLGVLPSVAVAARWAMPEQAPHLPHSDATRALRITSTDDSATRFRSRSSEKCAYHR